MDEVDFEVRNEGTVWIFYPKTVRAQNFTDTDLDIQPYQRWPGPSFVVDHGVAANLVSALQDEGFVVVSQD